MGRLQYISTCRRPVTGGLILTVLVMTPFADGVLLHEHNDQGIHSHAVTHDDLHVGDLSAAWRHHHDHSHDGCPHDADNNHQHSDKNTDDENGDSTFIFMNGLVNATRVRCSSGAVIASVQHAFSRELPRSILLRDMTASTRFIPGPWLSAQPLRPTCAVDALLQTSQALLL